MPRQSSIGREYLSSMMMRPSLTIWRAQRSSSMRLETGSFSTERFLPSYDPVFRMCSRSAFILSRG